MLRDGNMVFQEIWALKYPWNSSFHLQGLKLCHSLPKILLGSSYLSETLYSDQSVALDQSSKQIKRSKDWRTRVREERILFVFTCTRVCNISRTGRLVLWYSSLHRTCTPYSSLACYTNSHKLCVYSLCVSKIFFQNLSTSLSQHLCVKSPLLLQLQCTKAMYVIEV